MTKIIQRLNLLRQEMQRHNIDIYLVPSIDAHNSEYVPTCWQRRTWISGFNGSAGEALITLNHAYLSTDGRYFLQAGQQLDSEHYTLLKQSGFLPSAEKWLVDNAEGLRLGIDPRLVGIKRAEYLRETMQNIGGEVVIIEENLIDKCRAKLSASNMLEQGWESVKKRFSAEEEAVLPNAPAFALTEKYTGASLSQRLAWLRTKLKAKNADYIALNVLDEIAWLFNIRGRDIDYNPLVISYAVIGLDKAWLFVAKEKIDAGLAKILADSVRAEQVSGLTKNSFFLADTEIELIPYAEFGNILGNLSGRIWLDEVTASYWMQSKASQKGKLLLSRSPIVLEKACKNKVEIDGSRCAHVKDAAAVINFLYWLDNNWQHGVDEMTAAEKLSEFRSVQKNFRGESFAAISGFAGNGAIIHYRATPSTSKIIDDSNLYLLDSGGQYLEGTTDITRTVHLGEPTPEQQRHYTLVLKGHLALARAKFPLETCGEHLDVLARLPLWNEYLNYRHGTGHGVGSFLCVHEGPQKISPAPSAMPLLPGMIVSNEPGLYIDGAYGIRIENLCLVTEVVDQKATESAYGPFYRFEDLTLVPYCKKLMDMSLLSTEDINQIKAYYARIKVTISPKLDELVREWLDNELNL